MVEVLVTGVGTIGAHGTGLQQFCEAMDRGALPHSAVDRSLGFHRADAPAQALLVPPSAGSDWIKPVQARRLSKPSKFAVCAAGMALEDAGLKDLPFDHPTWETTAVCLGNPWGSTAFSRRLLQQIADKDQVAISPVLFMDTVVNAFAAQVALAHPAKGPNLTITQREASDVACLVRGAMMIASGRAQRVLAGVSGEMSALLHAVLGRFGALTRATVGRPFDRKRDGFLASEGATIYVLESDQSATRRNARVRARLTAWGRANDPTASATDWGTGSESLAQALKRGLARFGLHPDGIQRVISGASGSRRGDALEARLLRTLFHDDLPPVVAPKAIAGECGGGFLASLLWAQARNQFPAQLATPDPDPNLRVASRGACKLPPAQCSLVLALASGGAAAWLALAGQ